jgi:hypothetical protein
MNTLIPWLKMSPLLPWRRRLVKSALVSALLPVLATSLGGCTRRFYRERADKEVDAVLAEKDKYPDWKLEHAHVYPNPRARFADPTNPDRPLMPPDDPPAYDLSPNPQKPGKQGVGFASGTGYLDLLAKWDAENRAAAGPDLATDKDKEGKEKTEPATDKEKGYGKGKDGAEDSKVGASRGGPTSTTSLSTRAKPGAPRPFLLKLEQAVELGLINSREYQDARENLYLVALRVTLERFAFSAQFFAIGQAIREWAGPQSSAGRRNNWTLNSNVGFGKLFSTGGLLLLNFANQTVFNFTGGKSLSSQSFLNLDLVQPLLRGGGQAVTLEPLTQAERNLLYEIRTFARFRKTFYVAIAGGGGGSITGGAFQPVNVIAATPYSTAAAVGSSGLLPGIIPAVSLRGNPELEINPGIAGAVFLQTALTAPVSGYLSTLLQAAQMRVDEYNIEKLQGYLDLSKAMEEGGDISKLQVDQFEQQLLLRRTSLLTDQLQYLQSLDQLKLQLGLPTELPIELDDTPFRPLNETFQRYENLFREFDAASREALRFGAEDMVARVRQELRRIFTSSAIVRGTRFVKKIEPSWRAWEKLTADQLRKRLTAYREERRRLLDRKTEMEVKRKTLSAADQARLDELAFEIDLGEMESELREYESQPWKKIDPKLTELRRRQQQAKFRYVINAFILVLAEARNERVGQLRRQWPDLARLCVNNVDLLKSDLDEAEAAVVQAALTNRLDLMNVRAQVIDTWRQVAVFANALLGTFNVRYHLDSSTPAGVAQPLNFSESRTAQQLSFDVRLPLVRQQEQINYRASLIAYQRARRILQRAEDQVAFDVRGEIRLLRQQEENYRIQQRQVELAYMTVENSLDTFQAPPAPVPAGAAPSDTATRAAALTTQLLNAQTSLYNAQFQMTTIWITYLNTRLQLYRDMELMPLDYRGVWIDDVATCFCPPSPSPTSTDPGAKRPGPGSPNGGERKRAE